MRVEEAKIDEIEKIIDLGEFFVEESPSLSLMTYSRDVFEKFCKHMITHKDNCMFLLKDKDKILGILTGGLKSRIGSEEKSLSEYIFYVHKSARKHGGGKELMDRFCKWGKDRNAKTVEIGATSDIDPKKADAYMQKMGFKYMGANFYKELK